MKKYKLVKCYPGCPALGTILEPVDTTLDLKTVLKYPKFWEEVKEDYVGVCFKHHQTQTLYKIVDRKEHNYRIVWASNSDGATYHESAIMEYFTIGKWIRIPNEEYDAQFRVALFTTEDGVEIFKGDKFYILLPNNRLDNTYDFFTADESTPHPLKNKEKYFSTKQAADDYVAKSNVLFVTEDGKNIHPNNTYWCVNTSQHLWSIFAQTSNERTQLNKNVKAFSTEEKAQEYIDMNKPIYSLKQVTELHNKFINDVIHVVLLGLLEGKMATDIGNDVYKIKV